MRYFDTSALVKQYFVEPGSMAVRELLKSGERVFTAVLTYAETHAAFARRKREGILSPTATRRLALRFDKDWESYEVVLLNRELLSLARQILYRHTLRSADAIQLASALLLARRAPQPQWVFVCADQRLCAAASVEGLQPVDVTLTH
ncbi:MAG: type II toxin-antitoxin system VapC family toxin [Acidobacteria bacterium]|nr:type II toxin-antitoxin system VapC family toxin [Acidobacteriota bacterium]